MFSNQKQFKPKSLPQPQVKIVKVPVESIPPKSSSSSSKSKHRNLHNGASSSGTSTGTSNRNTPSRPSSSAVKSSSNGLKRTASGRPRSDNSPAGFASSADERTHLAPPSSSSRRNAAKRIRSPATDSERTRVAFDPSSDEEDDDADDWENRLKRQRHFERTDPARTLCSNALKQLAENGYLGDEKPLRFVHAADVVSLALGDAKVFSDANPEDLVVELQYPGSLTRERFELAKSKDKIDVTKDIIRVVNNVKESFMSNDKDVEKKLEETKRKLTRYSNDKYLDLRAFKEAVGDYNKIALKLLKSGAILASIYQQHIPSDNLVSLILNQVYDRVVTPQVDSLKKYENGTDNVYGEMKHNFVTQALSTNLRMTSDMVFVDLGSGVGNVVLQAALQIGCESWGCEMMEPPSKLAKAQLREFEARCKLWGVRPGKARVIHDNFRTNAEIREALKRADVVLANNQAFTPELNDALKTMFLDLKKGCKIVSLKKFTSSKRNINDIANSILSEPEHHRWPGKGVSWTDEVGDYHISTKIEGTGET